MTRFVHLTPEKHAGAIRRSGIKRTRFQDGPARGVFAMPVTPNFIATHQWLQELKRGGQRTFVGVYIRLTDTEPVLVSHYANALQPFTAAAASAMIGQRDAALGYRVQIPRKMEAGEIVAIRNLPQGIGWRYKPHAHGAPPCGCPACQPRGEIRSRRLRAAYEAAYSDDA
jgi:hypothetical protein